MCNSCVRDDETMDKGVFGFLHATKPGPGDAVDA
jgi:hypothetical protein